MIKKLIAGATVAATTAGLLAVAAPNVQARSQSDSIVSALVERSANQGDAATDRRWWDNDILLAAADALGLVPTLQGFNGTVFAPNDFAFRRLVADLTNQRVWNVSEQEALETLVTIAGQDGLNGTPFDGDVALTETVKYHVTAEQITNIRQRNRNSAPVQTIAALPADLADNSFDLKGGFIVRLADDDTNDRDPRVIRTIRAADGGTVHLIDRVLRPLDLAILFPED